MPKFKLLVFFLLLSHLAMAQLPSNSPPLIHHKNNFAISAFVATPNAHADVGIAYALTDRISVAAKFMIRGSSEKEDYTIGMSMLSLRYYRKIEETFIYGANLDLGLGKYQWLGNSTIRGPGPVFSSNSKGETNAQSFYNNLSIYGGLKLKKLLFTSSIGINRNDYFDVTGETVQFQRSLKNELNNGDKPFYAFDYSFGVRIGGRKLAFEIYTRRLYRSKEPALNSFLGFGVHFNLQGQWRQDRNDG